MSRTASLHPGRDAALALGGALLLAVGVGTAYPQAASTPTPTPTPTGTPAKPITLSPAAFSLADATDPVARDAVLTVQVDPADVAGAITATAPTDLPDGLAIVVDMAGAPLVDRDRTGQPTGLIRQPLRLRFSAIPRRLETRTILLKIAIGRIERSVEITATNLSGPPNGASLAVAVPTDLSWTPRNAIGIAFSAQGAPAPDIVLTAGPFVEAQTRRSAPIDLCLAATATGTCADGVSVAANRNGPAFLIDRGSGPLEPGSYTGTLRFLAGNGLKVDQTIQLQVTTDRWRWIGLGALVLGTLLSFLLTVYLPYQRDREFALRPFARLRSRLEVARRRRDGLSTKTLDTLGTTIADTIADKHLIDEGLVGGKLPSPYGAPDPAALKTYLDAQTLLVAMVERLTNAILENQDHAAALDAIASDPDLSPGTVETKIAEVLHRAGQRMMKGPPPSFTLAEIAHREDFRSGAVWLLSSVLSVILGYVILIDGNPAFGGWTDAAGALLWALGLSVAGGKVAEVTTGQLRGVLRPPERPRTTS